MGAKPKSEEEKNANRMRYIANNKAKYLEGRDNDFIALFEAKEVEKQYNSISAWKGNKKGKINKTTASKLIKQLDEAKKTLLEYKITNDDFSLLGESFDSLVTSYNEYKNKMKQNKIDELTRDIKAKQEELDKLK